MKKSCMNCYWLTFDDPWTGILPFCRVKMETLKTSWVKIYHCKHHKEEEK